MEAHEVSMLVNPPEHDTAAALNQFLAHQLLFL
jgi:hypothetical protein